jgi:hypothetical protein
MVPPPLPVSRDRLRVRVRQARRVIALMLEQEAVKCGALRRPSMASLKRQRAHSRGVSLQIDSNKGKIRSFYVYVCV